MGGDLCETKVLASGRDGGEDLLAEDLVRLVLGKIKLYIIISGCAMQTIKGDLRLKHVCELGSLSLLP